MNARINTFSEFSKNKPAIRPQCVAFLRVPFVGLVVGLVVSGSPKGRTGVGGSRDKPTCMSVFPRVLEARVHVDAYVLTLQGMFYCVFCVLGSMLSGACNEQYSFAEIIRDGGAMCVWVRSTGGRKR